MKLITSLCLALALATVSSAQPPGLNDLVAHSKRPMGGPDLQPTTFLGVEASPVSATLTDQLGLPDHIGLVVEHVAPQSPAAASLKPHDILTKIDDQWLIEPGQLAVLVRNHHEGDEVTLTYLRGGKSATASIKLGQKMAPPLSAAELGAVEFGPRMAPKGGGGFGFAQGGDGNRVFFAKSITADRLSQDGTGAIKVGGNSHIVLKENDGSSYELTTSSGKKTLVATGADGKQIFSGPVDTPEERKAMPPDAAKQLERLEHVDGPRVGGGGGFPEPFGLVPPPES